MTHPCLYILQAGAEAGDRVGGGAGRSHFNVKLCVVSIAMEVDPMPADDTTKGEHVDGEQGRAEHGALGDPTGDSVRSGFCLPQGHVLGPVSEVGVKPVEGSARETNEMLEAVEEDVVIYCVKRSREVEKNEEGRETGIRGHQQIAGDSDESCFCAVGGAKTRLEFFIQIIAFKVVVELGGNNFF